MSCDESKKHLKIFNNAYHTKVKKNRCNRHIIGFLLIVIIVCAIVFYPLYAYHFTSLEGKPIYEKTHYNRDTAIFFIRGEYSYSDDIYVDEKTWLQIEPQLFNFMVDGLKTLSDNWYCDLFVFYKCLPDSTFYSYENIIMFFSGHGDMKRFLLRDGINFPIKLLSKNIQTDNLTVIVGSCYSVNWQKRFFHSNLTSIFTSDLSNEESSFHWDGYTTEFWNEVEESLSYSMFFVDSLNAGANYYHANRTAFELCNYHGFTNYTL